MFVLDLLLLARTPMIFPDPGMQRVFIHSQVARGLGNRLIRLDRQFHGAFLECSGILLRSGLTHRTHLLGCVLSLVSVCPVEYNHIKQLSVRHLKEHGLDGKAYRIKYGIPRTQPLAAKEITSHRQEVVQRARPWEKAPTYLKAQERAAQAVAPKTGRAQ